jgi:hypothetical protein
MASQEEKVQTPPEETTGAEDAAKFSGAWDSFEAEESGQSATAAERQEDKDEGGNQGEGEAGQGGAPAGQQGADSSPEADAAAAASRETSDDVWKDADPKLREAHERELREAQERASRAENHARSNGGRLAKAVKEREALQKQLATKAGAEGSEANDDEIRQLQTDFPEVANPILKKIDRLTSELEVLTTSAAARAEVEVEAALGDEFKAVIDRHSDLADIVKAPEYADWVKDQPPAIQRIVHENSQAVVSSADVNKVFDDFKRDTGWGRKEQTEAEKSAAQRRQDQLEAGRSVSGAQPGVRSSANTGDGNFGDEWDKLEAQDRRKAAGRK